MQGRKDDSVDQPPPVPHHHTCHGCRGACDSTPAVARATRSQIRRGTEERRIQLVSGTICGRARSADRVTSRPEGPRVPQRHSHRRLLLLHRQTWHRTPTGVFKILQKDKHHRSSTYNDAPMPNMNRLTWSGIALHAGNLPGDPASHGCVRLPMAFSERLFEVTRLGLTVVIADEVPHLPVSSTPDWCWEIMRAANMRPSIAPSRPGNMLKAMVPKRRRPPLSSAARVARSRSGRAAHW